MKKTKNIAKNVAKNTMKNKKVTINQCNPPNISDGDTCMNDDEMKCENMSDEKGKDRCKNECDIDDETNDDFTLSDKYISEFITNDFIEEVPEILEDKPMNKSEIESHSEDNVIVDDNKVNNSFSFNSKKNLGTKINNIKNKNAIIEIFKIIKKMNPSLNMSENENGIFFKFNSLSNDTYVELEKYVNCSLKKRKSSKGLSASSSVVCSSEKN